MAEDWKKTMTFWKPKGNNSCIAKEIITKLNVHYSIVTYTQNEIHEIWCIAYMYRGYIDPTDHWPVFFWLADCLWDLANCFESTDHLLTIGRS